jgi:hypothetical protein
MELLRRHTWGIAFLVCFFGSLVACFSAPSGYFWWSVIGSFGGAIGALYSFIHRPPRTPFQKVYVHEDWDFAAADHDFPRLYIPADVHGMGTQPQLTFRQGDFVFQYHVDGEGNIVIIRDNHSIGRFANLGVIIRECL